MQSQSFLWFGIVLLTSFLWGCQSVEDEKLGCTDPRSLNYDPDAVFDSGECDYSDSYRYFMPEFWSEADERGNLLIVNETESPLHLFEGTTHLKVIPPKVNDFLVNVPVRLDKTQLDLYRAEAVDHIDDLPEKSFKSWVVVLGSTASVDGPVGWVVSDLVTGEGSGIINLSYPESDDNNRLPCNVDVFLHSKTGGRITTVVPGTLNKEVRIDYGTYRLWFHYWESDPSSSEGFQTVGWKSTDDIVLNANYPFREEEIPAFEKVPDDAAALMVVNRYGETINVKLGDRYIENHVVGRENTQAMSTIADRDSMLYPVAPDNYLLNFEKLNGSSLNDRFYVDLNKYFMTRIVAGESRHEVIVDNQTGMALFLGKEHYLGIEVAASQTEQVSMPEALTTVNVFNRDSTFFREIAIENNTLTIAEE